MSSYPADGSNGGAGYDSVVTLRVLGTDGGRDHGWADSCHITDAFIFARPVRSMVQGQASNCAIGEKRSVRPEFPVEFVV